MPAAAKSTATAALDMTTCIPSMIHDVQTLVSGNGSWQDKLLAGGDLLLNVAMDASMLIGVGEAVRAVYLGVRLGADVALHAGEEALAHEGEKAVEHGIADSVEHAAERNETLFNELANQGTKFSKEDTVGITKTAFNGQIAWLEKGSAKSGLQHILEGHADDFAKLGISQDKIPGLIMDTLESQTPSKVIPDAGKGGCQAVFSSIGDVIHDWSVVVGSNGYIVTAFPGD